jgi:hypothetical protein
MPDLPTWDWRVLTAAIALLLFVILSPWKRGR